MVVRFEDVHHPPRYQEIIWRVVLNAEDTLSAERELVSARDMDF